jgi:hypothetical protein
VQETEANWTAKLESETARMAEETARMQAKMDREMEEAKENAIGKEMEDMQKERIEHERQKNETVKIHEEKMKERGERMIKLFVDKIIPGVQEKAKTKDVFGIWKEEFIHFGYEQQFVVEDKEWEKERAEVEEGRRREKERELREMEARKKRDQMLIKGLLKGRRKELQAVLEEGAMLEEIVVGSG